MNLLKYLYIFIGWWKWPATFLVAAAIPWMKYRDSRKYFAKI